MIKYASLYLETSPIRYEITPVASSNAYMSTYVDSGLIYSPSPLPAPSSNNSTTTGTGAGTIDFSNLLTIRALC